VTPVSRAKAYPSIANGPASNCPLSIVYRVVSELKLNPTNPRLHSDRQIRKLAESIKAFHFNAPILVDGSLHVISGHGRLQAAKLLGLKEVPTIRLEHLTETQAKAFMIADNKLAESATWDNSLLAKHFKSLAEVELDFSLDVTGFEVPEIDLLIEGISPGLKGNSDPADDLPDNNPVRVTRAGDLWHAGPHRIYCGNSLNSDSYSLLMASRRAAMVVTAPPCTIGVNAASSQMPSGEMTEVEFTNFLAQVMEQCALHSVDGSLQYAIADWRLMPELLAAGKQIDAELINVCVWVKNNGGEGSPYRSQHELIFVFKCGKSHSNNLQVGQHGRCRTNVWHYRNVDSFCRTTEEGNPLELQPKPVALVADAIMDCTSLRDVVLDPFLGSGTTVIAAERTGRVCYGTEADPQSVDSIIRRWQAFTGQSATLERSGRTFGELEQEAGK
jgi:DNA modification methylase